MSQTKLPNWKYDPGEHRVKHCSNEPEAHFVRVGSAVVGKCAGTLTKVQAEVLLNSGCSYLEPSIDYPSKIYNVHQGVVYEAVPTEPGKSYHGYPWRRMPGRKLIPRQILKKLEELAEAQGCLRAYKDWMRRYG